MDGPTIQFAAACEKKSTEHLELLLRSGRLDFAGVLKKIVLFELRKRYSRERVTEEITRICRTNGSEKRNVNGARVRLDWKDRAGRGFSTNGSHVPDAVTPKGASQAW